jgi:ribosome-interacting GTPase 1
MGEYKQFNADVVVRDPDATVDDLIDLCYKQNRYNKYGGG